MRQALGDLSKKVNWHMIGHLQKNKINKALPIFNCIQTVDSIQQARDIDRRVEKADKKKILILLEINIGSEFTKSGINPGEHKDFETYIENMILEMTQLQHIGVAGLMTMGPRFDNPEKSRHYFRRTKNLFEDLKKLNGANLQMSYLSMGMSNTYQVAIEEGANMIRLGTVIFGPRNDKE